jgi:ABC-type transport system involved in multi-copper enzyme maturation permease subunit
MLHFVVLQGVYAVVFLTLAWWWFRRKDILE